MNSVRLLNVVRALRESPRPEAFTMARYAHDGIDHPCGTPACAIGHYAARGDLQDAFVVDGMAVRVGSEWLTYSMIRAHFGLSVEEDVELFSEDGCGDAQTTEEAASYIEAFVARKEASHE